MRNPFRTGLLVLTSALAFSACATTPPGLPAKLELGDQECVVVGSLEAR